VIVVTGATGHVGADRAFLMSAQVPGSAREPTHDLLLARAARRAGVRHVAKLSVLDGGAGEDAIGLWHRQAEILPTVAEVTGRPPTTFASWAEAHADRFTDTGA
jgi:uncharacterized protein YbjT (DUF2867 family)